MSILQQIREILTAPTFNAEDQTRTARLIHFILLAILCASAAFFIGVLLFSPERRNRLPLTLFFPLLVIGHLIMLRRVNVRYISISLTSLLWVGITASTLTGGGINHPGYGANIVIVGIAALLLGGRWALGFAGLSAVAGLVMIWAKNSGWIDARGTFSTTTIWLIQTMYFLVAAALIHLAARDMYRALNQVQTHEQLLLKRNRQLEEEIAQRKKVEEVNLELALEREKFEVFRQLIDEISHDIKTPLTTINTSLYLLSRSDDPQKQKEKIKVIQNQTEQLKTFVQNMLTLSRLEQIPELDLMPLEVNRLLHELVEQFRPTCVEKSLNLTLSTDATRTLIDADKDEFRRVILNLLENAINLPHRVGRSLCKHETTMKN